MKIFLQKTLLFIIIPAICWALLEIFLPPTFFTFRHSEAISFKQKVPNQFGDFPNINSTMYAIGDLCHHTDKAIVKKESWVTDKLGYRNDNFIKRADVLMIGDSFTQGCTLSQNEIISNQISANSNKAITVYNMAPSSFDKFDYCLQSGLIQKPKMIIFEIVERDIPRLLIKSSASERSSLKNRLSKLLEIGHINVYLAKILKANSIQWLKARIKGSKGNGIPAKGNPDMFFYQGICQKHSPTDLKTTSERILTYKKYCDSLGISFLFLPMPDKESVYYQWVPFTKQPNYLFKLDSILVKENIQTINTLKFYNEYKKTNTKLLYNLDDSHWNPTGCNLIAKEIVKKIKDNIK